MTSSVINTSPLRRMNPQPSWPVDRLDFDLDMLDSMLEQVMRVLLRPVRLKRDTLNSSLSMTTEMRDSNRCEISGELQPVFESKRSSAASCFLVFYFFFFLTAAIFLFLIFLDFFFALACAFERCFNRFSRAASAGSTNPFFRGRGMQTTNIPNTRNAKIKP